MVKERFIGFTPLNVPGNSFSTNAPDVWDDYYSTPVDLASPGSATYNGTNGLLPNVIYGIEYGTWIDGCNALTKKEKECLGYFNYQKFRVQSPLFSARSANKTLILEILDEKNKVIEKKEIKVKDEKRKKIKKSNRSKFERRN